MSYSFYTYVRWITSGLVILAIVWIWSAGRKGKPLRKNSKLVFGPSRLLESIYLLGILLFSFLVVEVAHHRSLGDVWWIELILVGFLVLLVVSWPYYISIDALCIMASQWTRRRKTIAWKDVDSVIYEMKKNKTRVTSKDGTEIIHEPYHVASPQFRNEVHKRTHVQITEV